MMSSSVLPSSAGMTDAVNTTVSVFRGTYLRGIGVGGVSVQSGQGDGGGAAAAIAITAAHLSSSGMDHR